MAVAKKRTNFFDSIEGKDVKRTLQLMAEDNSYATKPSYSADTLQYKNNMMPFVDKHMNYLSKHPNLDPYHYISNLRLMTRVK